ncbi:MAG: hypothetical protein QG597_1025 [Actinomycetota bacterium]|nr:hypothetical protein [Actinomycetota bacterium]
MTPATTGQATHGTSAPLGDEHSWGAAAVVVAIAAIQLALPPSVTLGPKWLIPAVEVVGAVAIRLIWIRRPTQASSRTVVVGYLLMLVGASTLNGLLLLRSLLDDIDESGKSLLLAGFAVLIINVLSFALVYWQLDGGGPGARAAGTAHPDFQFPQQPDDRNWYPTLPDYLFTAYTNIIAFSPTDTMPLTHRVKLLFTIQSSISLLTVLVTLSRAITLIN